MSMMLSNIRQAILPFSLLLVVLLPAGRADSQVRLSDGETVYVSIYSNVYSGPTKKVFQLGPMLSIRNTDPKYSISILKVYYYDSNGEMLDIYSKERFELGPLASRNFYIKEYDKRGGPGANFIVKWESENMVNMPIIEGIMLGMKAGQGISFTCPGQIITDHQR